MYAKDMSAMTVREITDNIFAVGVIDWHRAVFDELIPLPDGTTYNAYVIRGAEKTALVDTSDPGKEEEFITNLMRLGIGSIDYVVVNHAEQDHSGALPLILELFPMATVLATPKGRELLTYLLQVPGERIRVVDDGETIPLGGKTLEFLHAPWVHWPDTMLTYVPEDRVLFSCDLFGAHYATSDLFVADERVLYEPAKRYYAEIMMPFRNSIKKHMERISGLDISFIAPSHGPVHADPSFILDAYRDWISDNVKNEVVVPYVSMHGSTEKMVDYLVEALMERGITVRPFNTGNADIGKLAMALVDAATIVIATPTVLFGPHPKIAYAAFLANILKPKARSATVIGSFGWGGKTVQDITGMVGNLKIDLIEPVYIRGLASGDDLRELDRVADEILRRHREYGIA
ncbi:flavodoxin [hydrocarbon metagenome]|uniref:Flavodoxin n=1 Tax=hydrocarbon metagenome TaxID=938273 RepID=A0A0W8FEY4_9ZZZZ